MKIIDRFNICNVVKPGFAAHCIGKPFLAKQVWLKMIISFKMLVVHIVRSVGFKNDDLSRPDPISRSKLFLWTEISEREKERKKLVRPTSHHRLHVVPTKERYWQSEITVFSLLSKWSRCFLTIFFSFFYVQLLHENWIVS